MAYLAVETHFLRRRATTLACRHSHSNDKRFASGLAMPGMLANYYATGAGFGLSGADRTYPAHILAIAPQPMESVRLENRALRRQARPWGLVELNAPSQCDTQCPCPRPKTSLVKSGRIPFCPLHLCGPQRSSHR